MHPDSLENQAQGLPVKRLRVIHWIRRMGVRVTLGVSVNLSVPH